MHLTAQISLELIGRHTQVKLVQAVTNADVNRLYEQCEIEAILSVARIIHSDVLENHAPVTAKGLGEADQQVAFKEEEIFADRRGLDKIGPVKPFKLNLRSLVGLPVEFEHPIDVRLQQPILLFKPEAR